MREVYTELNYHLIEIPRTSVEERLGFLLNHVQQLDRDDPTIRSLSPD